MARVDPQEEPLPPIKPPRRPAALSARGPKPAPRTPELVEDDEPTTPAPAPAPEKKKKKPRGFLEAVDDTVFGEEDDDEDEDEKEPKKAAAEDEEDDDEDEDDDIFS